MQTTLGVSVALVAAFASCSSSRPLRDTRFPDLAMEDTAVLVDLAVPNDLTTIDLTAIDLNIRRCSMSSCDHNGGWRPGYGCCDSRGPNALLGTVAPLASDVCSRVGADMN